MSRYPPLDAGVRLEVIVRFPIDVKNPGQAVGSAFVRAERNLDRFRDLPQGGAGLRAINQMVDQFFEAAEAIWHIRDWLAGHLKKGLKNKKLRNLESGLVLRVLGCAANGSKHAGLREPNKHVDGEIRLLVQDGQPFGQEALADIYRKLVIEYPDPGAPGKLVRKHPTDFLIEAKHIRDGLVATSPLFSFPPH